MAGDEDTLTAIPEELLSEIVRNLRKMKSKQTGVSTIMLEACEDGKEKVMKSLLALLVMCWTGTLYAQDWPREIVSPQGTITIYQPQIESFEGDSLAARAAVSTVPAGKTEPVFGAVWLKCRVSTDRTSRTVRLEDVKVRRIKFPKQTDEETSKISATLEEEMPRLDLTFSLDLLLVSLETTQKERESARQLDVAPPKIIVMNHAAVLVLIDGDPVLTDVEGTSLKRVINTPYFLVQEPSSNSFYLRGGDIWYTSRNIEGPWSTTDNPPKAAVDLSEQSISDNESDVALKTPDLGLKTGEIPEIVVSTEPAELIATDGAIQLSPINGTGLLYASNTPSRLFLEIATQQYYLLVSGRWYAAKALTGPWTYVESKKLPKDFANIPPGSERDDVLSSVAGTIPAREAIVDALIPQTAEVDRATATTDVQYDGDPQFEPIENTDMEYAVNTPTAVIRVNGRYYNCENAVWFEGPSEFGPWTVCVNVPNEIYTIPPQYPVYDVRYVRVYGYTPSVAYVGYTAGYTGCYIYGGTVVYGTGYHYRSWYRHNYYARPTTWGFGVHYDPWLGWSFGASVGWGQPHGWFAYKSKTVYAGWWGPVGYRPVYRPVAGPAYRKGYQPSPRHISASKPAAPSTRGVTRSSGATRTNTIYGRWTTGVRRPTAGVAKPPATAPSRSAQTPTVRPANPPTANPAVRQPRTAPRGNVRIAPPQAAAPPTSVQPPSVQPANPPTVNPEVRQPRTAPRGNVRITPPPSAAPPTSVQPPTVQPANPPTANPAVRQPRTAPRGNVRITPPPSAGENNVYAAPDGSVLRKMPQGWQQRDQNTWKPAASAPAVQGVVRDQEVRQRAADRSSGFLTLPTATPVVKGQPPPKVQPAPKTQPTRNSGAERKKDEKKR